MAEPLVDRHFLERLEHLTLLWQKSFNGLVGGHNPSRFAGGGQEFLEHRNFHHGDDLRSVNWRAYMRFEKLVLKIFQVEPRVPVRLLLDTSASMSAASRPGESTKFDFARKLAAALTYVGLVRLDSILLQPFSSTLGEPHLCGGGRHRFQPAEKFLRGLRSAGDTGYLTVARDYLDTYPQRGLTIVVSDFFDNGDCFRALQYMADFGHELFLIHIWASEDREPAGNGEFELVDVESGNSLKVILNDESRESYRRAFDSHAERLKKLAAQNDGRYAGFSTLFPVEDAVLDATRMYSTSQ